MSEKSPSVQIRKRGPEPVARHALGLLKGQLAKRGFAQIELVTRWPEIAGTDLSVHCVPHKFSVTANGAAVLSLLADDRAALELQHQTPKLIDKINRYFGYAAVSKIKVIAGDIPKTRTRPTLRPLSAGEESELSSWTSQVSDPDLREALTRLGRNALAESRKTAILKR